MQLLSLILLFLLPSVSPNGPPDKSHLELIAEDFQILSRVTNAIALQAAAVRKTVTAHQVIVEILKITPDNFDTIISNVDADKAVTVLENLKVSTAKIAKDKMTSASEMKAFKDALATVESHLQSTSQWSLDSLQEAITGNLTQLKNDPELIHPNCTKGQLQYVNDYSINRKEKQILENFFEDFDKFVNCYTAIGDFGQKLKQLAILPLAEAYGKAISEANILPDFLQTVVKDTLSLEKDLDETIGQKTDNELDGTLGDQILQAGQAHLLHSKSLGPPLPSFTIAFFEAKDMLRVSDDLKSPWFQKHLIRGASTQKLVKSLEPFRQWAEEVVKFDAKWKTFDQFDKGLESNLNKVATSLKDIEEFVRNPGFSEPVGEFVKSANQILSDCVQMPDKDFDSTVRAFKTQELLQARFMSSIDQLMNSIKNMMETSDFSDTAKYVECLKNVKTKIPLSINPADVETISDELADEFNTCSEDKILFDMFLKNFQTLFELGNKLDTSVGKYSPTTATNALTLSQVLGKTNGLKSVECLRQKKFDIPNLLKMVKFVSSLSDFPSGSVLDDTITYLKGIAEVKSALKAVDDKMAAVLKRPKRDTLPDNPVLGFNNSRIHSENIAVCTLALWDLDTVRKQRKAVSEIGDHFDDKTRAIMKKFLPSSNDTDTLNPKPKTSSILKAADKIELLAKKLRPQSLRNMSRIFQEVGNIRGFSVHKEHLTSMIQASQNDPQLNEVVQEWNTLLHVNLDFELYHSRLKDGFVTVDALQDYFDYVFGRKKAEGSHVTIVEQQSWFIMIGGSFGIILLALILALTIYGFTKKGREKYKRLWLYYFGKRADFEKRWRYANFVDKEGGTNKLLEAVMEVSKENLLIAVKKGSYINAYNNFGNTALHYSAKNGFFELADILIRHGADRSLLNSKNLTPEQCIPTEFKTQISDRFQDLGKTVKVFKKYRNKKFRTIVPVKFPVSSFHVFLLETPNQAAGDEFMRRFVAIASFEFIPSTTHFVVNTDENDAFVTDNLCHINLILSGIIVVKESWIKACLDDEKALEHDSKYLVEKVKYKGVVYNTVLQWTQAIAKTELPYLFGVQVALVGAVSNVTEFALTISKAGGTLLDVFPSKENFNIGSRPYHHANLGPLFLIHDGTTDLSAYKNDPDKMYTLFTEEEFVRFLLKREFNRDKRVNPPSVTKDD